MTSLDDGREGGRAAAGSRYLDRGRIGKGGMGEVRLVWDTRLKRELALKVLAREHTLDAPLRQRFLLEAQIMAGLSHPGITPVFDQGRSGGRLWFTMRLVRGRTLQKVVRSLHARVEGGAWPTGEDGGFTLYRVIDAFKTACEAMAHAHSRGVVHRDLKPDNIMIGEFGEVQVMDWGIAKRLGDPPGIVLAGDAGIEDEGEFFLPEEDGAADRIDRESLAPTELVTGASTRSGDVLGTPGFMPPEQATGNLARIRPWTDVFALGACLYTILRDRRPMTGTAVQTVLDVTRNRIPRVGQDLPEGHPPIPPELAAIVDRAMDFHPEDRYADASGLAAELGAYLEGARRRQSARQQVAVARGLAPAIEELRVEARQRRARAEELLAALPQGATAADKAEAWSQEDHAAELDRRVGLLEVEWLQRLRAALVADPELGEAHDGIAEYYAHRLEEAERRRDAPAIARSEALLRAHGRSERFRRVLAGEGAITLHTTPPHARVKLLRFVEQGRRLVPVPERDLGRAPLDAVSVRHGSFLLEVEAPGHHTVRYPVFVGRGGHWKAVRPGASEVHRLWLPPLGELDEGERYVPAGWFRSGDAGAAEPLPTRSLWVDGFAISRTPVTHAAYLAFLDDLVARGRSEQAARRLPRMRSIDAAPSVRLDGDRHVLVEGEEGWRLDGPVVMVDWHDARAFAAWSSARLGRAYRLPDELEWEKAARGVDGRILPWGDFVEPSFANVLRSRPGDPSIGSVEDFPTDESVYGLRGLAGNVREWMENVWTDEGPTVDEGVLRVEATDPADPRIRSARGGGWYSEAHQVRLANRYAGQPDGRTLVVGFRLARSLGPSGEA